MNEEESKEQKVDSAEMEIDSKVLSADVSSDQRDSLKPISNGDRTASIISHLTAQTPIEAENVDMEDDDEDDDEIILTDLPDKVEEVKV